MAEDKQREDGESNFALAQPVSCPVGVFQLCHGVLALPFE
jgi:hypothetical protein